MNYKTLIYYRGFIIDRFINIELMINTIISQHYLNRIDTNFVLNVLNNDMSSFGFKKTILKQILDEKKHKNEFQKLEKLNSIRNLFGHASIKLISGNNPYQDETAILHLINPKNNDTIDPKITLTEFNILFKETINWLTTIGTKKGINYPTK